MRSVVGALIVIAALAGSSAAEDIYRWKDSAGGLHFENSPTPGERRMPAFVEPEAPAADASADEGGATADDGAAPGAASLPARIAPDEAATYSTDVSIRRSRLERELRGAQGRLREIDGRLANLERARMRNARGSDATGGVAAPARDVLSPEEETLVQEREQLAQHAVEVRNDAAVLRQEVEARLGTVPAWWTDIH